MFHRGRHAKIFGWAKSATHLTITDVLQAIGGLKATTFSDTVLSPMYVITEAVFLAPDQ